MQTDSFISEFEIIREIMHLILKYGTLTPKSLSDKSISVSKYNKIKPLLLTMIGDTIESRRYQDEKKQSLHITADLFSDGFSSLCSIFMAKAVKPDELSYRLMILQILDDLPNLTRQQLLDQISELDDHALTISDNTFFNYIKHLALYGQIRKANEDPPYLWSPAQNPLAGLSDKFACDLLSFVCFMRCYQEPGICGEQLFTSLSDANQTGVDSPFMIKNMRIGYVLDDAVLYKILTAIEASETISFDYTSQKQTMHFTDILPVKIISMDNIGRRYLFALNLFTPEHFPTLFLLDSISYVKTEQKCTAYTAEEKEKIYRQSVHFSAGSLHINTDQRTRVHLLYEPEYEQFLRRQLPDAELSEDENGICHAWISVVHTRELRPFLRKNAEWVKLAPDDQSGLLDEMKKEAAQWRALYGIIS